MGDPDHGTPLPPGITTSEDRLDSWKEIATYLKRDVTTVQRWEKREGMPIHRHVHDKLGSVYAFRSELDDWTRSRKEEQERNPEPEPSPAPATVPPPAPRSGHRHGVLW